MLLLATVWEYYYLGDRHTDATLRKAKCRAVRTEAGKCIRGKNGSMLVQFEDGKTRIIVGRLLRKLK
ncbi:hypothetical protein [Adhaeribacter soli]|uniref:Uncharacterized protein n=1 Tax=Adhaeribacter soli TaxID=2607655 RepID=A0A5N1IMX7_9BACT|nr:hypothetical protein [Adhaeribacter soli]KAA9331207.1 hypothetical protein F0P94_15075 [Adhaeribacter soli]